MEQQVLPCTAPRSVIIIQLYSPNRQQNEKEKTHNFIQQSGSRK